MHRHLPRLPAAGTGQHLGRSVIKLLAYMFYKEKTMSLAIYRRIPNLSSCLFGITRNFLLLTNGSAIFIIYILLTCRLFFRWGYRSVAHQQNVPATSSPSPAAAGADNCPRTCPTSQQLLIASRHQLPPVATCCCYCVCWLRTYSGYIRGYLFLLTSKQVVTSSSRQQSPLTRVIASYRLVIAGFLFG